MGLFSNIKPQLAEQGVKPAPITDPDFHDSSTGDTVTSSVKLTGPEYKLISHDNGVYTYKDLGYGTLENPIVYTGDDPGWHDSRAGDLITSKIQLTGKEYTLLGYKDGIYYYGDEGASSGGLFNKAAEFTGVHEFKDLGNKWLPHEMYGAADLVVSWASPIFAGQYASAFLGGQQGVKWSSETFSDFGDFTGINEFEKVPSYLNMYGDIGTTTIASAGALPTGGLSLLLIPLRAGVKAGTQEALYGNTDWADVGKQALIDTAVAAAGAYIPGGSSITSSGKALKVTADVAKASAIATASTKLKGGSWDDAFKAGLISGGAAGVTSTLFTSTSQPDADSNALAAEFARANPKFAWAANPKALSAIVAFGSAKAAGLSDEEAMVAAAASAVSAPKKLSMVTEKSPESALTQTREAWAGGKLSDGARASLAEVMTGATGIGFGNNVGAYKQMALKLNEAAEAFKQSRFAQGIQDIPGRLANAVLPSSAHVPLKTAPGAISGAVKDVPGRVANAVLPENKHVPLNADKYDPATGELKPEFMQVYDKSGNEIPGAIAARDKALSAQGKKSEPAAAVQSGNEPFYGESMDFSGSRSVTGLAEKGIKEGSLPVPNKRPGGNPALKHPPVAPVNAPGSYEAMDKYNTVDSLPEAIADGKIAPTTLRNGDVQYVKDGVVYTNTKTGGWKVDLAENLNEKTTIDLRSGRKTTVYEGKKVTESAGSGFTSPKAQWYGQKTLGGKIPGVNRSDPPPVLRLDSAQSKSLSHVNDDTLFEGKLGPNGEYTWTELKGGRPTVLTNPVGKLATDTTTKQRYLQIDVPEMSAGRMALITTGITALPGLGGLYLAKLGMDKEDERADENMELQLELLNRQLEATTEEETITESSSTSGTSVRIPRVWR